MEKIQIALGPQRAGELEAMLRVENIMQQGLRGVQGNSTTAAQIATLGLAGAAGGGAIGWDPTTAGASGLGLALATAGKKGLDQRVANRIAQILTSNDPAVLRRGAQMFANNQRLMNVLRTLDSGAIRVGAQQIRFPIPQAAGIGRAEDEQPSVPGGIGQ